MIRDMKAKARSEEEKKQTAKCQMKTAISI
jgi:hypothetical protein